jgi:hypothetical protein
MTTVTPMSKGNGNGNSNGDGNREGNGDRNGDGDGNGKNDVVVTTTDIREGYLFMCRQWAVLWQG